MKAIYIADDGTQFDNQDDCEFYETMTECSATCPVMSDGVTTFTFKDICGESAMTTLIFLFFAMLMNTAHFGKSMMIIWAILSPIFSLTASIIRFDSIMIKNAIMGNG